MRDLLKQVIKMYCDSLKDKLNNPKLNTQQILKIFDEIKMFQLLLETLNEQDEINAKASELGQAIPRAHRRQSLLGGASTWR